MFRLSQPADYEIGCVRYNNITLAQAFPALHVALECSSNDEVDATKEMTLASRFGVEG